MIPGCITEPFFLMRLEILFMSEQWINYSKVNKLKHIRYIAIVPIIMFDNFYPFS